MNDKLKQVEGILAKLAVQGSGSVDGSPEEQAFHVEVQAMRDRAERLKQELEDKVKKLGEAEELEDLATLRDEITPLGEEVDALEQEVDALLQANTGARLNAMSDRLSRLQGSLSQLTTKAQQKLEEYQALISEALANSQDDPSFCAQLAKLEAEAKATEAEIEELKARATDARLRQEEILVALNDAKAADGALASDKLDTLSADIDSLEQETSVLQESDQRITDDLEQRIKDFHLMVAENERAKANAQDVIYELNAELVRDFGAAMAVMADLAQEIDPLLEQLGEMKDDRYPEDDVKIDELTSGLLEAKEKHQAGMAELADVKAQIKVLIG